MIDSFVFWCVVYFSLTEFDLSFFMLVRVRFSC